MLKNQGIVAAPPFNAKEQEMADKESSSAGWFVGIIVALALLAIGYVVFSATQKPKPATTGEVVIEHVAPTTHVG